MQVKSSRFLPSEEVPCPQCAGYSGGCAGLALMGSLKTAQGIIAVKTGIIYENKKSLPSGQRRKTDPFSTSSVLAKNFSS